MSVEHSRSVTRGSSHDHQARPCVPVRPSARTPSHPLLQLQSTVGNQAVLRFLGAQAFQAKLQVNRPGDAYEREAERVADHVMRITDPVVRIDLSTAPPVERQDELKRQPVKEPKAVHAESVAPRPPLQNQTKGEELRLRASTEFADATTVNPSVEVATHGLTTRGQPLPKSVLSFMEPRFRTGFAGVRIHADHHAHELARSVNARAFTLGRDIVFSAGHYAPETARGRHLIAHELTHVLQQGSRRCCVQRHEAGEHARLGETQEELRLALAPASYVVRKGDTLSTIAHRFGIAVDELKEANKNKLQKWPERDGSGQLIEGFNAGETVSIPQKLNDFAKAAIKDRSATFAVNGVVLDYGVGIAMGDLFGSPEQMASASPDELKELTVLIRREQSSGKAVTTEEWQKATRGRYLKLAQKNVSHFAPPNPTFAPRSAAGSASPSHKSEWERHHRAALDASRSGDKDKALTINAYGDHFLTDAFSAGHLINKLDVMEQFKSQLKLDAKGKTFTNESKEFFDAVAKDAFTGSVRSEFSKYETVEYKGIVFRPNIDSVSRFSKLLQKIHMEEPDLLANAVAKGVHDRLNTTPGGLPVQNAIGDQWQLSGDGTLNVQTMTVARKAVAQSQMNLSSTFNLAGPIDYAELYKKVWDFTPRPRTAGTKELGDIVGKGTDVRGAELRNAVVELIRGNYLLIINELVNRKKLKRA